eukprot:Em0010g780a
MTSPRGRLRILLLMACHTGATPGSGSSSHSTVTAGPGAASSSGTNSKVKPADVGGGAGGPVIVILDNFAGGAMGIAWHGNGIDLEDNWSAGEDEKWNYVRTHLDTARDSTGSPAMFITFSSFTTSPAQAPRELARKMNPKLHSYVRENRGRLGIIASDYPGPTLIEDIIAHN